MSISCPLCQYESSQYFDDIFDDRYGHPGVFAVARCAKCHLFLTLPHLKQEELQNLYTTYYPTQVLSRTMKPINATRIDRLHNIRRYLSGDHKTHHYIQPNHSKILDIGCGEGASLAYLNAIGHDAQGLETNTKTVEQARAHGLNVTLGTIERAVLPSHFFDIIIANQLIEHVTDLEAFFVNVRRTLKRDGQLILSTPNGNSLYRRLCGRAWINWHIPYHQYIFTSQAMKQIAERYGWTIERLFTVTPTSWTLHQIKRLQEHPILGKKSTYWARLEYQTQPATNPTQRARFTRHPKKLLLMIIKILIIAMNRCIDLCGQGDNMLVFLRPNQSQRE